MGVTMEIAVIMRIKLACLDGASTAAHLFPPM